MQPAGPHSIHGVAQGTSSGDMIAQDQWSRRLQLGVRQRCLVARTLSSSARPGRRIGLLWARRREDRRHRPPTGASPPAQDDGDHWWFEGTPCTPTYRPHPPAGTHRHPPRSTDRQSRQLEAVLRIRRCAPSHHRSHSDNGPDRPRQYRVNENLTLDRQTSRSSVRRLRAPSTYSVAAPTEDGRDLWANQQVR